MSLTALLFSFFLTILQFLNASPAQAITAGPTNEEITISATITDNIPPTTPVLISPENNSYVTTGYVTFIWQGSTDDNGIKEYELSLDGIIYIPDIPPNDAETSKFTLNYDSATDYYTLKVKQLIADGTHTWKIRANDMLDNGTDSATWSFTVDTQAPNFILSQVGEVPTTISAQDVSTVPENPIELEENQPKLLGNGEANSTVVLTVAIPGDPTQTFTNTTDINGNWGQQLGILPRDTIMTLDFTITDQAGLISVLNDVQFIIKTKVFIFPPASPSPSPSPTITPTPGVTPPPTPPASPASTPLIAIPFTPPIEIAYEILQETWEHLPAPFKAIVARIPIGTRQYLAATAINLFPISALLLLALIGLLALLAMMNRFGKDLSPRLIWRTLQALHLLPAGKPQGLVYDSQTHQGIPFTLVEVRNKDGEIVDLVVTDKNGIYRGLVLKPGKYQLMVSHPDYDFPTSQVRPAYLTDREFYQSEIFEVLTKHAAKNQMLYLIPVDLLTKKHQNQLKIGLSLESFSRLNSSLFFPLFLVTGILTMVFPTVWNWLVFGSYCIQITFKASCWFKTPSLTGNTIDTNGQSLENTIVAVVDTEAHQFAALTQTKNDGSFSVYLPRQQLLLAITKPGFFWVENNESVTEYTLDTILEPKHVIVTLKITK